MTISWKFIHKTIISVIRVGIKKSGRCPLLPVLDGCCKTHASYTSSRYAQEIKYIILISRQLGRLKLSQVEICNSRYVHYMFMPPSTWMTWPVT